ncbi:MAG: ABC transporter ATP-binding protein [Caldilineaceae bacterium SB0664_bin_27]|uniref:ABC-type quaternary amine transporter n=1 Tax=Caldilineaceae bacterium SB0664_bin_27 TaxID=2605260 RepID=A0A6B0YRU4_9CHLR|nr:ABC transporter ATP-binding protein [Caldilineaceae bacterium SB0664_bin_27]
MNQKPPALRLQGVFKQFGTKSAPVLAVNDVSLTVERGEFIALLGRSGCGKTTTLRLIAGFERVDSGTIEIDGALMAGNSVHVRPERRRVGMVFQEYALFPHVSAQANIEFGLRSMSAAEKRARTNEILDLTRLAGLEGRMPHELSGGQQQRVALARALAPNPALILLDEPFSNLDAGLRARVRSEVVEILHAAKATAVFVTHDQEEALSMVDRVAVMLDGCVEQVASPHELYTNPASRSVAEFIGEANFLPGFGHGDTIECELGNLAARQKVHGPVDILLRPENIELLPAQPGLPAARVRHSLFFGHDQLITVQLPTGTHVIARSGPSEAYVSDLPLQLAVRSPVIAYPRKR